MVFIKNHLIKCFVAGIVAILPIAGLGIAIAYFENQVAGIWLKKQGFYFFGLGLLILTVLIYLIGLTVSTFIGRWIWNRVDGLLEQLPILGSLYQTLKQILGYGTGERGLFRRVVMVPFHDPERYEIGLVTVEPCPESDNRLGVFLPASPTPTSGRFVFIDPGVVVPTNMTASEAMQVLVSMGTLKADTLKADTLKADTLKADTLKVDTLKVDTLKVDTLKVDTLKAQATKPQGLQ